MESTPVLPLDAGPQGPSARPGTLASIQLLRAAAACAVVCHHVCKPFSLNDITSPFFARTKAFTDFWQVGVDVFFVISGFIMVVITNRSTDADRRTGPFLRKRFLRVIPLYWLYTTCFRILVSLPGVMRHHHFSLAFTLKSYLLIPTFGDDHIAIVGWPILGVGWTLGYEMLFYVAFACLIRLDLARSALLMSAAFAVTTALGVCLAPTTAVPLFFTNPLTLEFCLGMAAGLIYCRANWMTARLASAMTLIAIATFTFTAVVPFDPRFRAVAWGVPSFLIVTGLTHVERLRGLRVPRLALLLGDASYSVYLTHMFFIFVFETVVRKYGSHLRPVDLVIVACTAVAVLPGIAAYRFIEAPLNRWLAGKRWRPRTAVPAVAQSYGGALAVAQA